MWNGSYIRTNEGDIASINPQTIGQCTGLKDKNLMLIFEGDILKYDIKNESGEDKYVVEFDNILMRILAKNPRELYDMSPSRFVKCEIVGNIHDNPELMSG